MLLKKVCLLASALSFVLILSVVLNLSVSGIRQQSIADENAFCVIIDAGHGGFDGGAVAADGTSEKDINLQIALKLDEACRLFGFNTVMVRATDRSTEDKGVTSNKKRSDLRNRLEIMKAKKNCIFVSIHQNEYGSAQPHGTQVFFAPKVNGSKELAQSLQTAVKQYVQEKNNRVIKAGTSSAFLLYKAVCPAVIAECGFLSNPNDLKNLKNQRYQKRMAFAIAMGISNYCSDINAQASF